MKKREKMLRRTFTKQCVGAFIAIGLLPKIAWATVWNKAAFETAKLTEALANLGVKNPAKSHEILITAPDRAENGAIVQVEVTSSIPNTEAMMILVEKNPTPLIGQFTFFDGTDSFVITRIKMAETSDITVIVKAGEQFFMQVKNVVVLENGCG